MMVETRSMGSMFVWKTIPCFTCNATGHITSEHARWMVDGRRLTEARRSLELPMGWAAVGLGVDLLEWNDAEHGRADPGPMLAFMEREGAVT